MKVILKQDWIGPNGHRYRRSQPQSHTEVPDEFEKKLPSTAKIKGRSDPQEIRQADVPEVKAEEPFLAKTQDPDRAADDAAVLAKIEKARAAKTKE